MCFFCLFVCRVVWFLRRTGHRNRFVHYASARLQKTDYIVDKTAPPTRVICTKREGVGTTLSGERGKSQEHRCRDGCHAQHQQWEKMAQYMCMYRTVLGPSSMPCYERICVALSPEGRSSCRGDGGKGEGWGGQGCWE